MESILARAPSTDRSLAAAVHVLSIFFPLTAAGIAYLVFQKGRPYVAAHAISAFMDEIVLKTILFISGAISLGFTISKIVTMVQNGENLFTWDMVWQTVLKMAISWAIVAIIGFVVTLLSIRQAYMAYKGQWPTKGFAGRYLKKSLSAESGVPS